MNLKWSIIGLVLTGVGAAFCAALLTASLNAQSDHEEKEDPSAPVKILVAARDLAPMTLVDAESVVEMSVRGDEAPEGYLSSSALAIGRVLSVPVTEGQALTKDSFADKGPGVQLAQALPSGMRAMSVQLENSAGMDGLLYPGSVVDVLGSFQLSGEGRDRAISTTLLQNVHILAVDDRTIFSPEGRNANPLLARSRKASVTLRVNSAQAKVLQLAMQHGIISLALRNPSDQAISPEDATLLKGGRLAQLAEALEALGRGGRVDSEFEGEWGYETRGSNSSTQEREPAMRKVQIIRGTDVSERSFPVTPNATTGQ